VGGLAERGEEFADSEAEVGSFAWFGGEEGALMGAEGIGDSVARERGGGKEGRKRQCPLYSTWLIAGCLISSETPPTNNDELRRKKKKTHRFNFS
jgi:hypothetical protein